MKAKKTKVNNSLFFQPEDKEYTRFIQLLLESQTVFTLSDDEGIAECPSNEFTDGAEDEPVPVYCLWSSEQAALACRSEEWSHYELDAVPLAVLMGEWLLAMEEDGVLVGIDFDAELYGMEVEPVGLLGDLLNAAQEQGVELDIPPDVLNELMNYYLEWERSAVGQVRLN